MSVIVFDGTTLAADRQVNANDLCTKGDKLFKHGNVVLGYVGGVQHGTKLKTWALSERNVCGDLVCNPDTFPWPDQAEESAGTSAHLVLWTPTTGLVWFEGTPDPIRVVDCYEAWGSGAAVALGALTVGASAKQAVLAANKHTGSCGFGVKQFKLVP